MILQRSTLRSQLCHCRGQPGNGQGIHRQEQPVGTAEVAHTAAPQQIGQRQLEQSADDLGHQCRSQQDAGSPQKALFFRAITSEPPICHGRIV